MRRIFIVFILILIFGKVTCFSKDKSGMNVLILHSYHQGYIWTDSINRGINSIMGNYVDINTYFEYFDSKRNHLKESLDKKFEYLKIQAKLVKFDLIISCDNYSYNFMLEHGDDIYPNVPFIFSGINNFNKEKVWKRENCWYLLSNFDHKANLNLIKDLFPDRKNILVIDDNSLTGKAFLEEFKKIIPEYDDYFNFEIASYIEIDSISNKIISLDDDWVIYFLLASVNKKGDYISYIDAFYNIITLSKVPIISLWESFINMGVLGGSISTGYYNGRRIGEMAIDILNDKIEGLQKFEKSKSVYIFDYRQLKKFSIAKDQLPKNSRVLNDNISWEKYFQSLLYISLSLVFMILLLISFILYRKRQRKILTNLVKEKTKELFETNIALHESNKQKNLFLGMAAHDLRNPISTIYSISDLLIEDYSKEIAKEPLKMVETIKSSSEYMLSLVNDFLDVSVIESGEMMLNIEEVDYLKLIDDLIDFNSIISTTKNIFLRKIINIEGTLFLNIDKNKISQLINNLIGNAIKFSPDNSVVVIHVNIKNGEVITSIFDQGRGISSDELSVLFDAFRQTKTSSTKYEKGVGLGLAICKKIIETHGGHIFVESEKKKGSKFYFTLKYDN